MYIGDLAYVRKARGLKGLRLSTGGGVPGPYPAPSGYRWEYVTESGVLVTESGVAVVELARIN